MQSESATTASNRRRFSRFGVIFLSWDFLVGVPAGFAAAAGALFSGQVREALPGILVGVAAVGAAVATLVLTSLMVLIATVTPSYRRILERVKGGLRGSARPFQFVVGLAATSTAWSLVAAGFMPLVQDSPAWAFFLAGVSFALLLWAVFGCLQITNLVVLHWSKSAEAEGLEERRQKALKRSA